MEDMIEDILANPVYIVLALVVLAFLAFAIFRKALKLILIAVVILIAYAGYVYYTGGNAREAVKSAIEEGKDAIKK